MPLFQKTQVQFPVSMRWLTTVCSQFQGSSSGPVMYLLHRHTCRSTSPMLKMFIIATINPLIIIPHRDSYCLHFDFFSSSKSFSFPFFFFCVFIKCMWMCISMGTYVPRRTCRGQRTTLGGSILIFHIGWNWISLVRISTHQASWPVNFSSFSCLPFPYPSSSMPGFQRHVFYCVGLSESSSHMRLVWQGLCTLSISPALVQPFSIFVYRVTHNILVV